MVAFESWWRKGSLIVAVTSRLSNSSFTNPAHPLQMEVLPYHPLIQQTYYRSHFCTLTSHCHLFLHVFLWVINISTCLKPFSPGDVFVKGGPLQALLQIRLAEKRGCNLQALHAELMSDRTQGKAEVWRNMKTVFVPGKLAHFRKYFNTVKNVRQVKKRNTLLLNWTEPFQELRTDFILAKYQDSCLSWICSRSQNTLLLILQNLGDDTGCSENRVYNCYCIEVSLITCHYSWRDMNID